MKKKIKDLTLGECKKICLNNNCWSCPLVACVHHNISCFHTRDMKDLEKEVEVDE